MNAKDLDNIHEMLNKLKYSAYEKAIISIAESEQTIKVVLQIPKSEKEMTD